MATRRNAYARMQRILQCSSIINLKSPNKMNTPQTNLQKVKAYMTENFCIDVVTAMYLGFGTELRVYIAALRKQGMPIKDKPLKVGSKRKLYYLERAA